MAKEIESVHTDENDVTTITYTDGSVEIREGNSVIQAGTINGGINFG